MAEGLADSGYLPGPKILQVYDKWAKGGWGALLTGNDTYSMTAGVGSAFVLMV